MQSRFSNAVCHDFFQDFQTLFLPGQFKKNHEENVFLKNNFLNFCQFLTYVDFFPGFHYFQRSFNCFFKWLVCVVSTCLYGAFDCMLLSYHIRVSEWIYTLQLSEYLRSTFVHLTHYSPVLLIYTPWKNQKTFRFSDVFRGSRRATPRCNGLNFRYCNCFKQRAPWHSDNYRSADSLFPLFEYFSFKLQALRQSFFYKNIWQIETFFSLS